MIWRVPGFVVIAGDTAAKETHTTLATSPHYRASFEQQREKDHANRPNDY